jgi:hypothetical protein
MKIIRYFIFTPFAFSFFLKRYIPSKIHLLCHNKKFIGLWKINEDDQNNIVNIEDCGKVSKLYNNDYKSIGYWENNDNNFFINIRHNNIDKNYYGKIVNNTFFSGEVCEGNSSPYYFGKFNMKPIFYQFHNKTSENINDNYLYVDYKNITGKWMIENIHTKNIHIIEMYKNNTWDSYEGLRGKWNLYNKTDDINLNTAICNKGKNIWLLIKRDMNNIYMDSDILLLGQLVQLGKIYLTSEDSPCNSDCEIVPIVSKINGSVIYGFESDPEISESFYMKRWWG